METADQRWVQQRISTNNTAADVELSIRKKFHKALFTKFAKAINTYHLLEEGDKVAVCISGGKDSMLMAKLFQELKRHHKFEFELVFLVMDPGYEDRNRLLIEKNAEHLQIPLTIFETRIFDAVYEIDNSPCYLCARMRRGYLYREAQAFGCNKIALGHHYDDVIETILMGMLYGGQMQTMMPKLHSTNFEGMELIRPMYLIREEDIKHWRDYNELYFLQCACKFTREIREAMVQAKERSLNSDRKPSGDQQEMDDLTKERSKDQQVLDPVKEQSKDYQAPDPVMPSKRQEIKALIAELKKTNPFVESNIFKSAENVNLNTVIAYKSKGKKHYFWEDY